jgi:hypothetical protein
MAKKAPVTQQLLKLFFKGKLIHDPTSHIPNIIEFG